MKDLITKLQIDANCALGAIWMHIDAQAARIAELEAQIAAKPADADKLREKFEHVATVEFSHHKTKAWILSEDIGYTLRDGQKLFVFRGTDAELAAFTALQAPVREVPGWQPIETAPKDGTHILLWWGEQARLGWRLDNSHTRTPLAGWKVPSLQVIPFGCLPSHWMPLPAAPVQQEPKP